MELGELSAKYESNGDPGSVSNCPGDAGGTSYGMYQYSTTMGSAQGFVDWLCNRDDEFAEYGRQLNGTDGPGTDSFNAKWIELATADPDGMAKMEFEYTKGCYYDMGAYYLEQDLGWNIENHSEAMKQVLWSRSVQYGSGNMVELWQEAAIRAGKDLADMTDAELIENIYEVLKEDNSWTSGSPSLRPGLFNRFDNEKTEALEMLENG